MKKIQIFHNKRCTKSNQALNYLKDKGFDENDIDVRLYLENPLSPKEAERIVVFFSENLFELIRKEDAKKLNIEIPNPLTKEWVVKMIQEEPKLMQRPIIICNEKAVIGRPTENIDFIL